MGLCSDSSEYEKSEYELYDNSFEKIKKLPEGKY